MIDRIHIEKKIYDIVIPLIDETRILDLDKSSSDRSELVMFAAAIGIRKNKRTPLATKQGFVLCKSVPAEYWSQIFSLNTDVMRKENTEDKISDDDTAIGIIEEYANTGFYEIKNWLDDMDGKYDEDNLETIMYLTIQELDNMYGAFLETDKQEH